MVTVRFAKPVDTDIEIIHKYIYELGIYQSMGNDSICIKKSDLKRFLLDNKLEVLIAYHDNVPAGIGVFFTIPSGFTGRLNYFLDILYVEERERNQGIAREIIAYASRVCEERGYYRMDWVCHTFNTTAMDFYEYIGAKKMTNLVYYRLFNNEIKQLV